MTFETNTIPLSLPNARTGHRLTASVYDVTFDDGTMRTMSIGQLVMAICLQRATQMESDVIELMEEMADSTLNIDTITSIEQKIIEQMDSSTRINLSSITGSWTVAHVDAATGKMTTTTVGDAARAFSILGVPTSDDGDTMIEYIESKLDELNTNSQEQMILLQSQTNKRDQSYELISNALKSIFTVINGVVNNY